MAENLMNKNHKAVSDKYRENYDRVFNPRKLWANIQCPECSHTVDIDTFIPVPGVLFFCEWCKNRFIISETNTRYGD